ncbi:acyl-CoA thioesterase [Desulfosporosinus sp. PR]|uniref:acyl-CoA thioesterase n=1 Tax=Candidatus Desulfosporosinus nitrosoreducens TaxID=3401928 RepID=UPI0027FB6A78|nr:acyl-CoA thioesterase [Desulfosporosinus sp. PR]MDQ7092345.1 acyl-CoA thioesterase [Desulfosporosinus sp. PR]
MSKSKYLNGLEEQNLTRGNTDKPLSFLPMVITWGDCDAAGISYYARYFDWFTNGRLHLLKKYGFPYMRSFHDRGIAVVGLKAQCQYKRMLKPDEEVVLETTLANLTRTRATFLYVVRKADGSIAADGSTEHAFVDSGDGRPFDLNKRYPEFWKELHMMLSAAI